MNFKFKILHFIIPFFTIILSCAQNQNLICGEIIDETGAPSPSVTITTDGVNSIQTDSRGHFCIKANQKVKLNFSSPQNLCPIEPVEAKPQEWIQITAKKRLHVESRYQVGFNSEVTLIAKLGCDDPSKFEFEWVQIEGKPLEGRADGWKSQKLSFRTHSLGVRLNKGGVLSLGHVDAGWYRFTVKAKSSNTIYEGEAEVSSASVQSGVLSVPVDTDIYLDAGIQTPHDSWVLTKTPPSSNATLKPVSTEDGIEGVVSFRPDKPGPYELKQGGSGKEIVFEAGFWNSVPQDCDRPECHPSEYKGWKNSAHARALSARLGTPEAKPFSGRCLSCHTIGYNPGASNDGFDDIASTVGVFVSESFPQGGEALPEQLKRLGRVWCISCHGPGRLPQHGKRPMIVKVGVCSQCHDRPPDYMQVQEWKQTKMAKSIDDPLAMEKECAGCHTAQGAIARMRGRIILNQDPEFAEPVTCAVCHLAHTENKFLIRTKGTVKTSSGLLFEAGNGAVCIGCHQAGHPLDEESVKKRLAPFASQAEVQLGGGAWGLKGTPANISQDLCIDCHIIKRDRDLITGKFFGGHTFKAKPQDFLSPEDCNGDGVKDGIQKEIELCLNLLSEKISLQLAKLPGCKGASIGRMGKILIPVFSDGKINSACEKSWFSEQNDRIYKIAYNYFLIKDDGSKGIHNPKFAIAVLKNALENIGK